MTDFNERLREISRLIADNAPRAEILTEAGRLKEDMRKAEMGVWAVVFALDNLIAVFAPSPDWETGLWPQTPSASSGISAATAGPRRYDRRTRTLEIANEMREKGQGKVRTDEIAARLRSEGDVASIKNLEVAIGNLLSRSDRWA